MIEEIIEKTKIIQKNMKASQDRKNHIPVKERNLWSFEYEKKGFSNEGIRMFIVKGKLSP